MPSIVTSRPGKLEMLLFVAIMILAAALRLGWPGNVAFNQDEVQESLLALDLVHGRHFPLLGMNSSVRIPNPPMSIYLLAVPFSLSDSPLIATGYVELLSVIAVGMLYVFARRYYGPQTAVIAGLLYAVSPRAIIYTRSIAEQDLLPFFVIATVGTGLLGFLEGKRWAQVLHLPLLSIAAQIHYAAIVLIPITIILLVAGRRNIRRESLLGLLLAVIVTSPFILGISSMLGNSEVRKALSSHASLDGISVTYSSTFDTIWAVSGKLQRLVTGNFLEQDLPDLIPQITVLAALWLIFRSIWRRDNRSAIDVALVAWLTGTALIFSVTWTPVYLHYMITMLPGAFMVSGAAAGDLWQAVSGTRLRPVVLTVGGISLSVLVAVQLYVISSLISAGNLPNVIDGVGTPLGYYMVVRQAVLDKLPGTVLIAYDAQSGPFAYEFGVWRALLYRVPSVRVVYAGTDVYPAEKVVSLSHNCSGNAQVFWLTGTNACYAVGWRGPENLDLSSYTLTNDADLTFASGAHVLAYRWQPQQGCLTLVWNVRSLLLPDAPPGYIGQDYQFTIRFYNAQKTLTWRIDDRGWQGDYLRLGDTAIKSFCLSGDKARIGEVAGVRVGMYIMGGAQVYAANLFDPTGQYVGKKLMNIPFMAGVPDDEQL